MGHDISKDGLRKSESKVKAILEARRPENIEETRSLLGVLNFYSKFIPNFAHIMRPIYSLLKQDRIFEWSDNCERAFAYDLVLTHFNLNLPLILTTDSSDHGIAAILSHRMPDRERPIACYSRTLQPAEAKYSTIHKEAMALYWGTVKVFQRCMKMDCNAEQHTCRDSIIP